MSSNTNSKPTFQISGSPAQISAERLAKMFGEVISEDAARAAIMGDTSPGSPRLSGMKSGGSTGDDIDAALAMIDDNGGTGEWETDDEEVTAQRWWFPRFEGAEDAGDLYMSRSGIGSHDTDVETLVAWMQAPRNLVGAVMLLGEPGTGKTALIEAAATHADADLLTVLCTPDHTKDSLFLRFVGEGNGEDGTPFALGPIPTAAKEGKWLYMDEVLMLVDGVKPLLYALADGRAFLPEGNVDGSPLKIHPDFRLIMSSNPLVRGASLPEPLASRCASTTLTVETDEALLAELGIDGDIIAAWVALGEANLWRPQIRELRLANHWLDISATQALSAFLPEHCPETQREQVRNTVVSILGGHIREDGRLVVA